MIRDAVVLAAGRGLRLQGESGVAGQSPAANDPPKPLVSVCGLTLLKRTLLTLQAEGVTRAVVVLGYRGGEVRAAVQGDRDLGLEVSFVENPEWSLANGLSVLAARDLVRGDFLLTMADHVFDRSIVRRLQVAGAPEGGLSLAVDRRLGEVFDLADATKVQTDGDRIVAIGKHLVRYDAIDTGLFAASQGLMEALDSVKAERGDASLSEGVARLAAQGRARAVDVGGAVWQDVDTPEALREAERRLLRSLRKPTDGIVSRTLNRPVSLAISRRLCRTRVRPNQVTLFTFLVGCAAAGLAAQGEYLFSLLGALLYQAKSVLDGVDGEIARLKFQGSRVGEWLDTLGDDSSNLLFYAAVSLGAFRVTGDPLYLYLGGAGVLLAALCSGLMYYWVWTRLRSGDLLKFRWFFEKGPGGGLGTRGLSRLKYLVKQDFFVLFFLVLAVFGVLRVALFFVCGTGLLLLFLLAVHFWVERSSGARKLCPGVEQARVGATRGGSAPLGA
jgi:choline kinase/phosphatidylglycerophosphate synthase